METLNVSVNWLNILNKFLDGMIFGLGFMVMVILIIWITKADKNDSSPKPQNNFNNIFMYLILTGVVCVNFAASGHNFYLWFVSLLLVGATFIAAILQEETKILKEEIKEMEKYASLYEAKPITDKKEI